MATREQGPHKKDASQDERLTVVEVTTSRSRDTVVEAISTYPGKRPDLRRFKIVIQGLCKVKFGWLIGFI